MSDISECEYYKNKIPPGATVCTGCGAEKSYGGTDKERDKIAEQASIFAVIAVIAPFIINLQLAIFLVTPFFLLLAFFGFRKIRKGPSWFRRRRY